MSNAVSFLAQVAAFALRAVDPCAPLGVLECARWALSERARDGLCIVLLAGYCGACVLGACVRAPRRAAGRGAVSPEKFWPEPANPHTYYVEMDLCGRETQ